MQFIICSQERLAHEFYDANVPDEQLLMHDDDEVDDDDDEDDDDADAVLSTPEQSDRQAAEERPPTADDSSRRGKSLKRGRTPATDGMWQLDFILFSSFCNQIPPLKL